jgi:(p)ppGpp synthase/HD superfamily hydrolase
MKQEAAYKIAEKHCTLPRRDGSPAMCHVRNVPLILEELLGDTYYELYELKCVAILHDVVEDCLDKDPNDNSALEDIQRLDETGRVSKIIEILTHRPGEPYEDYITRIVKSNSLAPTYVKLADMIDNLTTDGTTINQKNKYRRALPRLIKRMAILGERRSGKEKGGRDSSSEVHNE